jgi:uncharacterized SAM-binding protein YcdF (DUF218 family)
VAMATGSTSDIHLRSLRRTRRLLLALAGIALLFTVLFLIFIGRWLVVEDPLGKAQAIVVLSGGMPLRAKAAAKLYREGYAPEVWLTYSTEPGATLKAMGVFYVSEDAYDTQVLVHEGVPAVAIRLLQPAIINTADEIAVISAQLSGEKGGSVIIVTSKAHTRRVRVLWHRFAAPHEQAVVRAASDDPFDPKHWWRTTGEALEVVREVLGILNAWAGMPLHPAE